MNKRIVGILAITLLASLPFTVRAQPPPPPPQDAMLLTKAAKLRSDVLAARVSLDKAELLRTRVSRSLGFSDGPMCVTPPATEATSLDIHRSMFVHDAATMGSGKFTLSTTLQKLSTDVAADVPGTTPVSIFRQFWDTQASAPGVDPANTHCSDSDGKLGDIPLNRCPRQERNEAVGTDAEISQRIDSYTPLALVNRLDLADKSWKNCGEYRIVYGKQSSGIGKNLIIFEAVLPNPKPGCRSGCRDVIEFWDDLSKDDVVASRITKLEKFYYQGLPGFLPVVHTNHFQSGVSSTYGGSGSGQIRTNQFIAGDAWTLKEFKTLLSCSGGVCSYDIMPISVKVNPYGPLWNGDVALGASPTAPGGNTFATPIPGLASMASDFQASVIAQVIPTRLGTPDPNNVAFEIQPNKNAAESQATLSGSLDIDQYQEQMNAAADSAFRTSLNQAGDLLTPKLTADQIANRALTQSCAGCHRPVDFRLTQPNALGPGQRWPDALTFVHVDVVSSPFGPAQGFDPAKFGDSATAFNISPALSSTFLPFRRDNFAAELNKEVCDCVRTADPLTSARDKRISEIITRQSTKGVRDIAAIQRRLAERPNDAFQASRQLIRRSELVQLRELSKLGVAVAPIPLQTVRVVLSSKRLDAATADLEKRAAIERIVNDEPPRQTITGSFRSH